MGTDGRTGWAAKLALAVLLAGAVLAAFWSLSLIEPILEPTLGRGVD